jgi:predicted nucleic acid-binding protein
MLFLDSDVLVDVLRRYSPALAWLESQGDDQIWVSGFVAMELHQGCRSKIEHEKVKRLLNTCRIVWPSTDGCVQGYLFYSKQHLHHPIGILDVLIGYTAIDQGVSLWTFNIKHYQSIPGLSIQIPYSRQ